MTVDGPKRAYWAVAVALRQWATAVLLLVLAASVLLLVGEVREARDEAATRDEVVTRIAESETLVACTVRELGRVHVRGVNLLLSSRDGLDDGQVRELRRSLGEAQARLEAAVAGTCPEDE